MLEVLSKFSPRERERLLSRMVLDLNPDPAVEPKVPVPKEEELTRQRILKEIQPSGTPSKHRIYSTLSNEISKSVFMQVNETEVKQRLGQKGLLNPRLYKIGFSDFFKKETMKFGITRSHVEDSMRSPHRVEHLMLPGNFSRADDPPTFSLYLKMPRVQRRANVFSLLVLSTRNGADQSVIAAWRVYHSEVDVSKFERPLDVLRAFAEKYGMPVTAGNRTANFILYEVIPILGDATGFMSGPKMEAGAIMFFFKVRSDLQVLEVACAFHLDVNRYKRDLRRHGLNVH